MATKAKDEAIEAIRQIQDALEGTDPIVGLRREQLAATAAYAARRCAAIEELKIARRQPRVRPAFTVEPQPELASADEA